MIGILESSEEDKESKRKKNEEYRAFLQLQIEEKDRRLEIERREQEKHPLGSQYESPSLPYRKNLDISSLTNRQLQREYENILKSSKTTNESEETNSSVKKELQKKTESDHEIRHNGKAIFARNGNSNENRTLGNGWQKSSDFINKEILKSIHKSELRKQIAQKQQEREEQRRKEEMEDAKLEQKIREYHEELKKRDEKARKDKFFKANKFVPEAPIQRIKRHIRNIEPETHLPKLNTNVKLKPTTPPIERFDPEITLAAKLNQSGSVFWNNNSKVERTNKSDSDLRNETGSRNSDVLPYIGSTYGHNEYNRIRSPPVPAVYSKIYHYDYERELTYLENLHRKALLREVQGVYTGERAQVERNLRNNILEDDHP